MNNIMMDIVIVFFFFFTDVMKKIVATTKNVAMTRNIGTDMMNMNVVMNTESVAMDIVNNVTKEIALKNVELKVTDFVMNIFFVHTVVVAMNVNQTKFVDVAVDVAVLKDILNSIINP